MLSKFIAWMMCRSSLFRKKIPVQVGNYFAKFNNQDTQVTFIDNFLVFSLIFWQGISHLGQSNFSSITYQKQSPRGSCCVFYKKVFLEISKNSQEKPAPESLFFIQLQAATLRKKRLWDRYFLVTFVKLFRTPFLR